MKWKNYLKLTYGIYEESKKQSVYEPFFSNIQILDLLLCW